MKIKNKTGRIVHLIDDSNGYRDVFSVMPFVAASGDKPAEFESVDVPDHIFEANKKYTLIAYYLKEGELLVIEAPASKEESATIAAVPAAAPVPPKESEQMSFGKSNAKR